MSKRKSYGRREIQAELDDSWDPNAEEDCDVLGEELGLTKLLEEYKEPGDDKIVVTREDARKPWYMLFALHNLLSVLMSWVD